MVLEFTVEKDAETGTIRQMPFQSSWRTRHGCEQIGSKTRKGFNRRERTERRADRIEAEK
jgi:hypothetical protein